MTTTFAAALVVAILGIAALLAIAIRHHRRTAAVEQQTAHVVTQLAALADSHSQIVAIQPKLAEQISAIDEATGLLGRRSRAVESALTEMCAAQAALSDQLSAVAGKMERDRGETVDSFQAVTSRIDDISRAVRAHDQHVERWGEAAALVSADMSAVVRQGRLNQDELVAALGTGFSRVAELHHAVRTQSEGVERLAGAHAEAESRDRQSFEAIGERVTKLHDMQSEIVQLARSTASVIEALPFRAAPVDSALRADQQGLLQHWRADRLFAIVSWGCAATQWLSKILNTHPELLCVHGGISTLHRFNAPVSSLQYLRTLAVLGNGYSVAGDVHGIPRWDVPLLREAFGEQFAAVVVVREPLARIRSQMALWRRYRDLKVWNLRDAEALIAARRLVVPDGEEGRMFVHAANMLNAVVDEAAVGTFYTSEALTSDPQALLRLVTEISGGTVQPDLEWARSAVALKKVNAHASSEGDFADWQLNVLYEVVSPDTWRLYADLGYEVAKFPANV